MSNAVVVQPWSNYPPAVAKIRVLNTNEDEKTILFLEPLWVWGQKVYAEDSIYHHFACHDGAKGTPRGLIVARFHQIPVKTLLFDDGSVCPCSTGVTAFKGG